MGHSCAVASASAKPQSTCPLHGAAVSDPPGVRVPHQLPWVPPGCGNDPQSLLHHDIARKRQPVDLAPGLPSGPWVMWQTPRWGGNRSEEARCGLGQLGGGEACPARPSSECGRPGCAGSPVSEEACRPGWPWGAEPLTLSQLGHPHGTDVGRAGSFVSLGSQLWCRLLKKSCPRDPKVTLA